MSYEKQNFVSGQILKADHLNYMEDGIVAALASSSGLSDIEKSLILSLFKNSTYSSDGMSSIYNQLAVLWNGDVVTPTQIPVPATSLKLNKTTLNLVEGDSETLTATVLPANTTDSVTWAVSPSEYATVNNGTVIAVKTGICTVTATAGTKSASCKIYIEVAESKVANSNPFPDIQPVYMLQNAKTLFSEKKDYIDTGLQLFKTIDPAPSFTILLETQIADRMVSSNGSVFIMHCMQEADPWPGMTFQTYANGSIKLNCYRSNSTFGYVSGFKTSKTKVVIRMDKGVVNAWNSKDNTADLGTISSMTTEATETLLLGARQETTKKKTGFYDGTFYQCVVYDSALTNAQIYNWLGDIKKNEVAAESLIYDLDETTFKAADKKSIDTGVKLFEDVTDSTAFTLYLNAQITKGSYSSSSPIVLCDSFIDADKESDMKGLFICTWGTNGVGINMFNGNSYLVKDEGGNRFYSIIQYQNGKWRYSSNGGNFSSWKSVTASNVDKSLLIGASWGYGDGKNRFFDGTIYNFRIWDKVLSDDEITELKGG